MFVKETDDIRFARRLLKMYFKGNLQQIEADILVNSQISAQDLWVEAVRGKELNEVELELLVRHLPWYFTWSFPVQLSTNYLTILFAECNPEKIAAYCCNYALPEEFEKLLIEKYKQSLGKPDAKMMYTTPGGRVINGWAKALRTYLTFGGIEGERLTSKEVQKQILMLGDDCLTEALIKRCSIVKNILDDDIIWDLVERHKEKELRLLLLESYIPNLPALMLEIERKMPGLQDAIAIANYRRDVYLLEQKHCVFLGALTPLPRETSIINKYLESSETDKAEIAELYIKPWLNSFKPCMCAYVAYHFPDFAAQARSVAKNFATKCLK